jgi:hypothetical protein
MPKPEALEKAVHSVSFAVGDLQAALKTASVTEALLLVPLIQQAVQLQRGIESLRDAVNAGAA